MTNEWRGAHDCTRTGPDRWDSSWPGSASPSDRLRLFGYLEKRFGIPAAHFDAYMLFQRGDGWYILKRSGHLQTAGRLKVAKPGLRAFRAINAYVKPSTRFIQIFGHAATKGTMELTLRQLAELRDGGSLPSKPGDGTTGYVILTAFGGQILGLGFCSHGRVRSQLPRRETATLVFTGHCL